MARKRYRNIPVSPRKRDLKEILMIITWTTICLCLLLGVASTCYIEILNVKNSHALEQIAAWGKIIIEASSIWGQSIVDAVSQVSWPTFPESGKWPDTFWEKTKRFWYTFPGCVLFRQYVWPKLPDKIRKDPNLAMVARMLGFFTVDVALEGRMEDSEARHDATEAQAGQRDIRLNQSDIRHNDAADRLNQSEARHDDAEAAGHARDGRLNELQNRNSGTAASADAATAAAAETINRQNELEARRRRR